MDTSGRLAVDDRRVGLLCIRIRTTKPADSPAVRTRMQDAL